MDVRKKIEDRKRKLRINIEAIKVTKAAMSPKVMNFQKAQGGLQKHLNRLERELAMLEETWSW